MSAVIDKIKTRGYWRILIRPAEFCEGRISDLAQCKSLVRESRITLRGWDYPHYGMRSPPTNGIDFVEQTADWENHIEWWRLYQSGQFIHYVALCEDWYENQTGRDQLKKLQPKEHLSITGTVSLLTELYQFASRLAAKGALGEACEIEVDLRNTKNRKLTSFNPMRPLLDEYRTSLDCIPRPLHFPITGVMAEATQMALDHSVWLFERFNWDHPPMEAFRELQRDLLEKR